MEHCKQDLSKVIDRLKEAYPGADMSIVSDVLESDAYQFPCVYLKVKTGWRLFALQKDAYITVDAADRALGSEDEFANDSLGMVLGAMSRLSEIREELDMASTGMLLAAVRRRLLKQPPYVRDAIVVADCEFTPDGDLKVTINCISKEGSLLS